MQFLLEMDDVAVINLGGELDASDIEQVRQILLGLLKSQKSKVVLNFAKVEHVNYKYINLLLEQAFNMRRFSGDLKCASLSPYTRSIFRFVGADQILEDYASVADAVNSFDQGEPVYHQTWH